MSEVLWLLMVKLAYAQLQHNQEAWISVQLLMIVLEIELKQQLIEQEKC